MPTLAHYLIVDSGGSVSSCDTADGTRVRLSAEDLHDKTGNCVHVYRDGRLWFIHGGQEESRMREAAKLSLEIAFIVLMAVIVSILVFRGLRYLSFRSRR